MAEIKSLGEQHQMEWNDTMSLGTSAWWFNCLKNMEHEVKNEDGACHIFDELNEFPTGLNNANEWCKIIPYLGKFNIVCSEKTYIQRN